MIGIEGCTHCSYAAASCRGATRCCSERLPELRQLLALRHDRDGQAPLLEDLDPPRLLVHCSLRGRRVGHLGAQPQEEPRAPLHGPAEARVELRPGLRPISRREKQERLLGMVRRHPEEHGPVGAPGQRGLLPRVADAEALAQHQELAGEARVGVADGPRLPETLVRRLKGDLEPPHEVSNRHRCRPADTLAAVHQDAPACINGALHPLERPVEQRGYVLAVRVFEVVCDVAKVLREGAVANICRHVHDVGDPVPPEALEVPRDLVASEVDLLRDDLRARLTILLQLQRLVEMVRQMVVVLLVVRVV
mmetsp:Transcript_46452/g.132438  ORF Transcript_46452/g.132438 Transcript_46452/m.132438 type:complete len:307 (-) Transcript_46452:489-1409(-)